MSDAVRVQQAAEQVQRDLNEAESVVMEFLRKCQESAITKEKFLDVGRRAAEVRDTTQKIYYKTVDKVIEQLKLLGEASNADPHVREQREVELRCALERKELAERQVDLANGAFMEWWEQARAREEDQRTYRQERATSSATWAAWGSAVAAIATLAMSIWNVWQGRAP